MGATAVSDTTIGMIQIIVIALAGVIILSVAWEEFKRRK
jgi:hypothetical protein